MMFMARAKEMQAKNPSVISLAGGEPDFLTPARITSAAIKALEAGDTHYRIGAGIPELRTAIANKLKTENGIICDENRILITPGGKNAIYLAINAVLNYGDEAIILDPAWVSYEPIIIAAGGKPVHVKLKYEVDYRITYDQLAKATTEKTRLLIINYPNNPTGRILHQDEADAVEKFLLDYPNVYLLSDEVYEKIMFDNNKHISMGSKATVADRVITVNGFSKCVAMTGWRMGYLTSSQEVFSVIYKLYQHSLTCMSGFLQQGAVEAFNCAEETETMRKIYQSRRDKFIGELNSIPGVCCKKPEGAFYAWVAYESKMMSAEEICEYLLKDAGVVGMPGTAYNEFDIPTMRFSFANSDEDLEDAATRIKTSILKLF